MTDQTKTALLYKLRAPVADESPMAKVADALREKARQEQQAYQERREADRPASAPVSGEAQPVIHQHGFAADNQRLRAINESLDKQLEEVMTERDEYHDVADKLAEAIADHLLVEIGEHSSSNCPWMRALDAIQNAAPQASGPITHYEAGRPNGDGTYEAVPVRAAPQASEAARNQWPTDWAEQLKGEYAQGLLDGQQQASETARDALKTCGSKVFKALAAIARADGPDTRKADDPELIYREPVMDEVVRIRQAYDELSSALSAQSVLSSGAPNGRKRTAAERRAPMVERVYGTGVTAQPAQKEQ
ncbi:hypothetical protein [Achromobacter denitrificans]|uniref:Uncharacterized protein n=1 Tax=Achromobacter denitrificans TaxID=32002 RepID=A0ABZ3GC12_ACHDE